MSQQTIADDLKAARALLEKGWCKHVLEDGKGGHCALGAIVRATTGDDYGWNQRAVDAAVFMGNRTPGGQVNDLVAFNNAAETTPQDVLDLFDSAIAVASELAVVFTPSDAADLALLAEQFVAEAGVSA
jgi:hypothetical protein